MLGGQYGAPWGRRSRPQWLLWGLARSCCRAMDECHHARGTRFYLPSCRRALETIHRPGHRVPRISAAGAWWTLHPPELRLPGPGVASSRPKCPRWLPGRLWWPSLAGESPAGPWWPLPGPRCPPWLPDRLVASTGPNFACRAPGGLPAPEVPAVAAVVPGGPLTRASPAALGAALPIATTGGHRRPTAGPAPPNQRPSSKCPHPNTSTPGMPQKELDLHPWRLP